MFEPLFLSPFVHTYHSTMGNTASAQPVQTNVQSLVIGDTEMTTLNFQYTLTYILISLGIALVLGVLFYFYRKYQKRGRLARPMTAARRLQEMEVQHSVNIHMSQQPFPYGVQNQFHCQWYTLRGSTTRTLTARINKAQHLTTNE